jgi:lipopolysaccharide export system permease protein
MARFHWYITFEILKIFSITLFAATSLIMVAGVLQQLVAEGLGALAIVQLIPYILPVALQFAVPVALLFAACSVYGRMSADNEIVAVKSVGISPGRVMTPTLLMAFLLSPVAVWTSDLAMSWGMPGINRVVMHSIEEVVYRVLRDHRSYSTSRGFSIHVQDVQDRWLIQPTINMFPENGKPMTISAIRGQLKLDPENETLKIQLEDAQWEMGGKVMGSFPGTSEEEIPLSRATRKGTEKKSPSQYSLSEMNSQYAQQEADLKVVEDKLATLTGLDLMTGRFDRLDTPKTFGILGEMSEGKRRLSRLTTEPYRRWAMGFSCFFFVWLGIPLAIWMKSADYWTSFGACFLPILVIYYPLFALGFDRAKNGVWPAYTVWLGDIVLFIIGLWLMRKVYRH